MRIEQELNEHRLTHQPSQGWCRLCRMARGRDDPHSQRDAVERATEEQGR